MATQVITGYNWEFLVFFLFKSRINHGPYQRSKKGPLTSPWISKVRGAVGNKRNRMAELPAGVRPRKLPLQAAQREQLEQLEHSGGPKASILSWSGREDPSRQ